MVYTRNILGCVISNCISIIIILILITVLTIITIITITNGGDKV